VPAGGLSIDGDWWVRCRKAFFLPVRVLSRLFRGKLLAGLRSAVEQGDLHVADRAGFDALLARITATPWMVYSKPPFGGPEQALQYLARYTHRIAITNNRLVRMEGDQVVFRWKDYAAGQAMRELTLPAEEFLRRFLLHVLPDRFVRIRSYGLLANRSREAHLALCRRLLPPARSSPRVEIPGDWQSLLQHLTGRDTAACPHCGQLALREIEALAPQSAGRPPP
jgi:hypothetical protein